MKLLTLAKESAGSATSNNFWKEKLLNMVVEDVRVLYARKEVM